TFARRVPFACRTRRTNCGAGATALAAVGGRGRRRFFGDAHIDGEAQPPARIVRQARDELAAAIAIAHVVADGDVANSQHRAGADRRAVALARHLAFLVAAALLAPALLAIDRRALGDRAHREDRGGIDERLGESGGGEGRGQRNRDEGLLHVALLCLGMVLTASTRERSCG